MDHKKCWEPTNGHCQIMLLEKILESPLDSKNIQLVNHKGNQPWMFTEKNDTEAPIIWLSDAKSQLIELFHPDDGKDWRQREKLMTEDKMVRKHHWLNGQESEQTLGVSKGQRGLACYSSLSCRVGLYLATEQQPITFVTFTFGFRSK